MFHHLVLKNGRSRALTAVALGVFLLGFSVARALDVDDVKELMANNVAEEVIVNMVKSDGTLYITMEEANEFRARGASENLIAALRPRAITTTQSIATATTPTIVTDSAPETQIIEIDPTIVTTGMPAAGTPITPAAITSSTPYPPRFDKEGWVVFSNHDWIPYYLNVNRDSKRMFLSKAPNGGIVIDSGQSVTINVRKEGYKLYGDSGNDLRVKVRENETTTVSLNPYGVFGNSGLTGVSTDRDKVRSEVLFGNYVPAPPTIIVEEPPVIVVPGPPVYYHRPYYRRPPNYGFHFGYRRW